MKTLHITSWYPSPQNPSEGIFIKEHHLALKEYSTSELVHLQFKKGKLKLQRTKHIDESQYIIYLPIWNWRLVEILNLIGVLFLLLKKNINKNYDIVNFHIAYPQLMYIHIIKRFLKIPIVLTEHWTAYRYSFNITKPKPLRRLRKIFSHNLPTIVVSNALKHDIINFAPTTNNEFYIIPNVVNFDTEINNTKSSTLPNKYFFSLAVWRPIKKPIILLESFHEILKKNPDLHYYIGGYGDQIAFMQDFINRNNLKNHVTLLGLMNKPEVLRYMSGALAFLHCSEYETFSVVCAESICTGTPAIISNIPAIKEFINSKNGRISPTNTTEDWSKTIQEFLSSIDSYSPQEISTNAISKFSRNAVGKKYYETLLKIKNDYIH
ncbi:glycosyltransferase family 4 protein [Gilvimarinus agarilyticus]|nr:glycosyltransferase family 4 protein [Gilvimarinus agarilyticus]